MIHVLATSPATAHFISYKLARRFVADEPPAALVDRAAATFRKTDGDIREVVRTIVTSPEFSAPAYRQAKVKTPFEFVVSAVRASGRRSGTRAPWPNASPQMGMPLYLQQPPTGYKDTAEAWVSTSGLLARLNSRAGPGRRTPARGLGAGGRASPLEQLVPAGLSETTRRTPTRSRT